MIPPPVSASLGTIGDPLRSNGGHFHGDLVDFDFGIFVDLSSFVVAADQRFEMEFSKFSINSEHGSDFVFS